MLPIRKILHATDLSDHSRPAFDMASALARNYRAELHVLHVVELPFLTTIDGVLVPTPIYEAESTREQLENLRPHDPAVTVAHRLFEGDPAEVILALARDLPADLVVMGTHGRGGLSRTLMGSVAEAVVREATCPVLTAKFPFPADLATTQTAVHATQD